MTAIDTNPLNTGLCGGCDCTGFAPKIDYVIDPSAKTVVWTDTTTYTATDSRGHIRVRVYDQSGKVVSGTATGSTATLNTTTLQMSDLTITATVISTQGCKADLGSYHLGAGSLTGTLGNVALQGKRK